MSIFYFEIDNDLWRHAFLAEAENFVGATMQATDFMRKLDEAAYEEIGELDSKITVLSDTDAMWANDAALKECLEMLKEQHRCEEED